MRAVLWAEHLKGASCKDEHLRALQPLLRTLLHEKLLSWLEVHSLVNSIPSAERLLQVAVDFLEVRQFNCF